MWLTGTWTRHFWWVSIACIQDNFLPSKDTIILTQVWCGVAFSACSGVAKRKTWAKILPGFLSATLMWCLIPYWFFHISGSITQKRFSWGTRPLDSCLIHFLIRLSTYGHLQLEPRLITSSDFSVALDRTLCRCAFCLLNSFELDWSLQTFITPDHPMLTDIKMIISCLLNTSRSYKVILLAICTVKLRIYKKIEIKWVETSFVGLCCD